MPTLRTRLVLWTLALLFSAASVYAQSLDSPGNSGKTTNALSGPAASPIAFAPAPFNLPQTLSDAARPIFRPTPIASAPIAASRSLSAPVVAEPLFELPSLLLTAAQSADGYDEWRARMDAARSKRRTGMLLTAGGILGGPLVAGTVFAASPGEETATAAYFVSLAGLGVGVWGISSG